MSISIDQETFDKKYDTIYRDIMKDYNINYESAKEVFKTLVKANGRGVKIDFFPTICTLSNIDSNIILEEINEIEKNLDGIHIDGMF